MEEMPPFRLRYVGARFDGPRMPLDVLPDLPAFRDLLVSYVKAAWLDAHAGRERVPRGFGKSLKFDLVGIEDGSAVPAIAWDRDNAQRQLPEFKDEMEGLVEAAYDKAVALVAGSTDLAAAKSLEWMEVRALNSFGSSLLSDERIEFVGREDTQGQVVYLNAERRKRLLTRGRESYKNRFDSLGKLLGYRVDENGTNGFVTVSTHEHGTLRLTLPADRVKEEFDGMIDADVQFRLMIELDKADKFLNVIDVLEIDLIDAKVVAELERCRNRIGAISSLSDGWHDGSGKAPTSEAITASLRILGRNPRLAQHYHIYPTDEGGVLFELAKDGWDYSIEIGPTGKGEIYGVEITGDAEMETGVLEIAGDVFQRRFDTVAGVGR